MKKLLWKPSKISWQIHLVIAIIAIIGLSLAENIKINRKQPHYTEKIEAARLMKKAMYVVGNYRKTKFGEVKKSADPLDSGLVGFQNTPITTASVEIDAKLTTINPNWAAVMVQMFKKAKVKQGDVVAVALTSSFPALDMAVYAAAAVMKIKLIVITSVASSTWGANIPEFTWLDMEHMLFTSGIFPYRSIAASMGGVKDNALGITEEGRNLLKTAIKRNNIPFLYFESMKDNIDARMDLYHEHAAHAPITAFINVGGGTAAVGTYIGKQRFKPGLNIKVPSRKSLLIDSLMSRFAKEGIPVINMNGINKIAKQYKLPTEQKKIQKVGEGDIYYRYEYNPFLIVGVLLVLFLLIYFFIRLGFGYRIFTSYTQESKVRPPEHMV